MPNNTPPLFVIEHFKPIPGGTTSPQPGFLTKTIVGMASLRPVHTDQFFEKQIHVSETTNQVQPGIYLLTDDGSFVFHAQTPKGITY